MEPDDQMVPSSHGMFDEILTTSSSNILPQTVFRDSIFALRFAVLGKSGRRTYEAGD